MKKTNSTPRSHDDYLIDKLRTDPEMAAELLKVAVEELDAEGGDFVLHKVLHMIAKAQGIGKIARKAGIPPEARAFCLRVAILGFRRFSP